MQNKRLPEKTPGEAFLDTSLGDDFTMPATLYFEALGSLDAAILAASTNKSFDVQRNLRSTILLAFAALEAQLNQIASSHAATHKGILQQNTLDILEECETTLDERGHLVRRPKFYPFDARFGFLVAFLSGKKFDFGGKLWSQLKKAKSLRDKWTHPKPPFKWEPITPADARACVVAVRDTLVEFSRLVESAPPLWLTSNSIP